ncbi:MAG: leucyl aminopeptidase family protein [Saprospiraceae bacterium]|nr:leucyl aminopeptidase family protein [Saprospiraceae bacterium]
MQFKLRKSPQRNIIFSLIFFDRQFCNENTASYFEENYGVFFNPEDPIKNHPIFQIIKEGKVRVVVLFDVSDHYSQHPVCKALLDFSLAQASSFRKKIQIDLKFADPDLLISPLVQALELSIYDLALYKTGKDQPHPLSTAGSEITLILEDPKPGRFSQEVKRSQVIGHYQREVMNLVNAPYNRLNTKNIVTWIRSEGRRNKLKISVFDKAKIEKTGLHALMAVNRGSESDPAFIIAEYQGNKKKDAGTIGLVGKGVTFDTGGLSIKPSANMHYMKSDMGGAATVLGTISAIAAQEIPVNIIAITPITDNCVDANSIKPGDVIESYSGKTIEIIDTDAEGRLILADALAYLTKNYEVDHIIDLATLTGSAVRTFGSTCAALFSNDDELSDTIYNVGMETGEKVWPLPLWDEYQTELNSDVADIKNLATKPVAGAITAAKFLQAFTADHPSWAHLDIAGVSFGDTGYGKMKAATGWGVHLLCEVVKALQEND